MAEHAVAEHRPTYISEMMERLGIDPGEGAVPRLSLSYVTAFHRCEACGDKQACREWLDSMPRSVVSAPRFCPNVDILFELAVNQPRLNPVVSPRDHAHIADLERLEDEIDDLLVQKPTDDPMIVELKGRKLRLQRQIEWLRHEAFANRLPH